MNKAIAAFLTFVLLFTSFSAVGYAQPASQQSEAKRYSINLASTELGKASLYIYVQDDTVFMDLDDVIKMTRTTKEVKDNIITLKHGTRSITLDTSAQTLEESELSIKVNDYKILNTSNKILVPAFSLLTYLGAKYSMKGDLLYVSMPAYTLWEATDFDTSKYNVDISQIWGSEKDIETRLYCDVIMQMIYGVGVFGSVDYIIKDAMYSVLDVDMYGYSSVQEENARFLQNIEAIYSYEDLGESAASLTESADFILQNSGLLKDYLEYGSSVNKDVAEMVLGTQKINDISKSLDSANGMMDAGLFFTDIFVTVSNRANYTKDTVESMLTFINQYKTSFPEEYQDNSYYQAGNRISLTLKDDYNRFVITAAEESLGFIADQVASKGMGMLLTGSMAGINSVLLAVNVAKFVTGMLHKEFIASTDSDMKALLLTDLQALSYKTLYSCSQDILTKKDYSRKALETYRQLWIYWIKTTMAMNDYMIDVYEFDKQIGSADILKNRNEALALQLYKLSYCTVADISDPSAIYQGKEFDKQIDFSNLHEVAQDAESVDYMDAAALYITESGFYYIGSDEYGDGGLFRYNEQTGLTDKIAADCDAFVVSGQYIFYNENVYPNYDSPDGSLIGGQLHRCNTDGTNDRTVGSIRTTSFAYYNNHIYYHDLDQLDGCLYMCDLEGGNPTKLFPNEGSLRAYDSTVYINDETGIFAASGDGTNKEKISDINMSSIGIYGDILFGTKPIIEEPQYVYIVMKYLKSENGMDYTERKVIPPTYSQISVARDSNGTIYYTALNDSQAGDPFSKYVTLFRYNPEIHDSIPIAAISPWGSIQSSKEWVYYIKDGDIFGIDSSNNERYFETKDANQIIKATDEWIYYYAYDEDGANSILKRYNIETKKIEDFGTVYTYKG
jgi:hypothetical protein